MSDSIVPGQRYLCDPEPELGLGRVTAVDARSLCLEFPAQGVERRYARHAAPLRRVNHAPGDRICDETGLSWIIESVAEQGGLYHYAVVAADGTQRTQLPESALAAVPDLDRPLERLLGMHCDPGIWFDLRMHALDAEQHINGSPFLGLASARTALLPHQLYIAYEVSRRPAPRVLLCDEVGLGKTIEACMILQQQLFNGLAARVLILVPDALLYQWLVELLRRFNLRFTILDHERCEALAEGGTANPFESAQGVLCSIDFLASAPCWHEQAMQAEWDLLIVDEAHHLHDGSAAAASWQTVVEPLADRSTGLLLLSATPDAGGSRNLFQLLHLLDPHRFHDFATFQGEQAGYIELAASIDRLLEGNADLSRDLDLLSGRYAHDSELQRMLDKLAASARTGDDREVRETVVRALLDRHGTGRIMFRNSRRHVGGFPRRELHATRLPLPERYSEAGSGAFPEMPYTHDEAWLRDDPRVAQVELLLAQHRQCKFLLICHAQRSAEALENWLRLKRGVRSAVFHEGLSLLERDRAAAWFAEQEGGAQVLVCSEIGSEGRNFQFAQDLILFDLPPDPELLEQRIGRLDRIGQVDCIRIHVPWLADSAQGVLLRLFDEVFNLFDAPNPVAAQACQQLAGELEAALAAPMDAVRLDTLLTAARALEERLRAAAARGRDRLLELNSCRPLEADAIVTRVADLTGSGAPVLADFLDALFAAYGLDIDVSESGVWALKPADHMLLDHFPQLPDEGLHFTLQRELALYREDLCFMTWLHPLVLQGIDLVLQGESGKAACLLLRDKRLPAGTLLLEARFRTALDLPRHCQAWRWLDGGALRVVIDEQRRELGKSLPPHWLQRQGSDAGRDTVQALVQSRRPLIEQLHRWCLKVARQRLQEQMDAARARMHEGLQEEIDRLQALQRVNPLVPQAEIEALEKQRDMLQAGYQRATPQTEALRLVLVV